MTIFRFIIRASSFIAIIAICGYGLIWAALKFKPAFFTGSVANYHYAVTKYKIANKRAPIKNMIIGDSRGCVSIRPKLLGDEWFNFSVGGSDQFDGYLMLKHFLKHNKIDTLIIMYGINYLAGQSSFFSTVTIPYQLPLPEEYLSLEKLEKATSAQFHGKFHSQLQLIIDQYQRRSRYLQQPFFYRENFMDGLRSFLSPSDRLLGTKIVGQIQQDHGYYSVPQRSSVKDVAFDVSQEFEVNKINQLYQDSLISLAVNHQIKTYFVLPPFNEATTKALEGTTYQKEATIFINLIGMQYPAIKIIEDLRTLPDYFFADPYHLNEKGSLIFTEYLMKTIRVSNNIPVSKIPHSK